MASRHLPFSIASKAVESHIFHVRAFFSFAFIAVGLAIGLACSLALARILQSEVFTVPLLDPLAFTAAAVLLSLVALLACYIPARRATKVDPMNALRAE